LQGRTVTLDTNLWLDLLLFEDAATLAAAQDLQNHGYAAALNAASWRELLRVLALKSWHKNGLHDKALSLAQALSKIDAPAELAGFALYWTTAAPTARLPQCRDASDQLFLELAAASSSEWLLTKDRALLKCRAYPLNSPLNSVAASGAARGTVLSVAQFTRQVSLSF
jgi:uncharacterized protein